MKPLAVALALALPSALSAAEPPTTAIVGGTILTVSPQGKLEKGTLLIQGGKIVAVGKDVAVPRDAAIIDVAGRYVMPGIIDAHSHTGAEDNVNECTDAVTAEVRVTDVIDQRDVDIYRELAGGVTTINLLHGSCNSIGGQNAVLKLRWGKDPEGDQVRAGREPQAQQLPHPRLRALPGHADGGGGHDPRGLQGGPGVPARVG